MATSRQTPRVWSDAIRGSEILANWFKLGANAVVLWLSIGMVLGSALGGFWFLEGTTSLDRRLWLHHVRNGLGIGGPIADLPIRTAAVSGFLCPRQRFSATRSAATRP